jgi:Stress responsive A/B Barrel Domain
MKLRHVVLFGFGKAQSPAAIAEAIRRFAELKALVPSIDDFEWGESSSPDSHVFLLIFANARARDAYLVHPDHAAFANWVQPFVSSVTVLDYWVESKARLFQATPTALRFPNALYLPPSRRRAVASATNNMKP